MAERPMRFHERLEAIEVEVTHLFALVSEDLAAATAALLSGDGSMVAILAEREKVIDTLLREIEEVVCVQIAHQAPVARDLRFLLSVLRIVPELERSHDLVEHIAEQAGRIPCADLPAECAAIVSRMGEVGAAMWGRAADAWYRRDPSIAAELQRDDDAMDDLHRELMGFLEGGSTTLPVALNLTLVARFYERLGDHAVNIARRVVFLAGRNG